MTDKLFLEGIEVFAHGGISEGERAIGQHYRIDVTLELDLDTVARTDRLEDAVSYVDIDAAVRQAMTAADFHLLETATERVAQSVLRVTGAEAVTVRLRKLLPPLPGVAASGVEMRRRR
ncbi:MAG TPA: dihydroneopterin aldolase [Chloroflexota bacterium]|nr:dihydroneopterin aldolase [Chloroflexota bacterium]